MASLGRALLALLVLLLPALPAADVVPPPAPPDMASLRGQLLIATPQIGDPRFSRTVILMVRHDASGAFGIILNRPFEERTIASLLEATGRPTDGVTGTVRVFLGGPVEPGAGFIVHTAEYRRGETWDIDGRLAMSQNPDVLRDIGQGKGPAKLLFAVGYAGWAPGQLEGELARRDWFTASASARLVFDEDRDKVWDMAMSQRARDL
jgi:putative transcriptional regulator